MIFIVKGKVITYLRNRKIIDAVFDGLFFRHFSQKNNSVTKAMQ